MGAPQVDSGAPERPRRRRRGRPEGSAPPDRSGRSAVLCAGVATPGVLRRSPRRPHDPRLAEILEFLNDEQVRATYGAVAEVLSVILRSMGARLGPHSHEASWIV